MKFFVYMISLFVILCLGSCGKQDVEEFIDQGTVTSGVYENKYFNFTVKLPEEFIVADKATTDRAMKLGQDMLEGSMTSSLDKAAIRASDVNTMQLFWVSEHEIGAPVESNPNLICMVERIGYVPGIKKAEDYLYHARQMMRRANIGYKVEEQFDTAKIGGHEFTVMYAEIGGMAQNYYTTLSRDFALSFIVSYMTNDELDYVLESLNTLTMH